MYLSSCASTSAPSSCATSAYPTLPRPQRSGVWRVWPIPCRNATRTERPTDHDTGPKGP